MEVLGSYIDLISLKAIIYPQWKVKEIVETETQRSQANSEYLTIRYSVRILTELCPETY